MEGEYLVAELPKIELVLKMIGKELKLLEELPKLSEEVRSSVGNTMITASELGRKGAIKPFNLEIRKGEVVGLAGLLGSGRTEIARLLFGVDRPDEGKLVVAESGSTVKSPRQAIDKGIAFARRTVRRKVSLTT